MSRRFLIVALVCLVVLAGGAVAAVASQASAAAGSRPVVSSVTPAVGPAGGGATVTIRGARFARVAWVTMGGKRARGVHVRSSGVLTVVTPPHAAGGAAIVVREKSGTSLPSRVRYLYAAAPRISGLSVHSGPVTGGQVVTISGSSLSRLKRVSFGSLRAAPLAGSTSTRVRVRTPASWAGTVQVVAVTAGGTSASSAAGRYTFRNPAPQMTSSLTPASGDAVAAGSDVTAVTGGKVIGSGSKVTQQPWTVTLAATAVVPALGQQFLLQPGGTVYPGGLAGTVTAIGSAASPVTITVAARSGTLASAVESVRTVFSGPLGDATAASGGKARPARVTGGGPSLTSSIDFGDISASDLACEGRTGKSVKVTGGLSLKLEDVEAHVEVNAGSSWDKPFIDVWLSYQPTIAVSITVADEVKCSLPVAWQTLHSKLFFLGDSGATIAIAPDASFTVSAEGTVSFQQHSYRLLGFVSNPDGTISQLDGKRSDPATVNVSGGLKAEAYAGVQVQVGELNVIGVGMSVGGGVTGGAEMDMPGHPCLSLTFFLRGTLYAYLSDWVQEWKLQAFQVELDLPGPSTCAASPVLRAWNSPYSDYLQAVPTRVASSTVTAMTFGFTVDYALERDGTVDRFDTRTGKFTPVHGVAGITMLAETVGDTEYALRDDGRVLAWDAPGEKSNSDGALGDGTTRESTTPVLVRGISTAIAVSAGSDTGYALLSDGTVLAWGGNEVSQLGDGKFEHYVTVPQAVPGLSDVRQVDGAYQGAFAVLGNGTVMKWGCDSAAATGSHGVDIVQDTPAPVPGVSGAIAVAGGRESAYALTRDGVIWSWGNDWDGAIGRGFKDDNWHNPAPITGLPRITAIAASQGSAGFALAADGHLYSWGSGPLGVSTTSPRLRPAVISGLSDVAYFGAGFTDAWAASPGS